MTTPAIDLDWLAQRSSPTIAAAKHFGISLDAAFLLSDFAWAALGEPKGWPQRHPWHDYAINCVCGTAYSATEDFGGYWRMRSFLDALTTIYRARIRARPKVRPSLRLAAAQAGHTRLPW